MVVVILSIKARRWTCQGMLCLHFQLHFGVLILIQDSSDCYLRRGHYGHNYNAFSLSPTTIKLQKKMLYNFIQFHFVAILYLAKDLSP